MIGLDGEKMSKSKGNLVFVSKLIEAGSDPMTIRWALMKDHYRTDRMWSDELFKEAEIEIVTLRDCLSRVQIAPTEELITNIIGYLADDLDTESVIAALNTWMDQTKAGDTGGDAMSLAKTLDALLGIQF
jgi:L-cysteine:1D-myo-inositol 2-amino-2-deoxy-alpha-D-glucopyranoside ligase